MEKEEESAGVHDRLLERFPMIDRWLESWKSAIVPSPCNEKGDIDRADFTSWV
jgi:hypothetical protein